MSKPHLKWMIALGCGLAITAAAGLAAGEEPAGATATLMSSEGRELGTVSFTEGPNGLLLGADLHDLPAGTLAFHLHGTGSCTPDFKAGGGHFNPSEKKHGFLAAEGPHLGDMPNIHVPESGKLAVELFLPDVTIGEGKAQLMDKDGTSVMIHAKADDYKTDPAGGAGNRIACGVIKKK